MRLLLAAVVACCISVVFFHLNYWNESIKKESPNNIHFHWMGPFWSGGGYGSEAIATVLSLHENNPYQVVIQISHHGDSINRKFISGLPSNHSDTLFALSSPSSAYDSGSLHISVCHSEPGAWYPANYQTAMCPPAEHFEARYANSTYSIGRTMFETDRLPSGWAERCNKMDEIWVPTDFHIDIFKEAGVSPAKLFKIPEPVDIDVFNRDLVVPLDYNEYIANQFGRPVNDSCYRFLSIFKWEARKGWTILLEAYFREFLDSESPCVSLLLLTQPYHNSPDFMRKIQDFVALKMPEVDSLDELPHVAFIQYPLPQTELPKLYKAADCFVLPSRGEGWGRPHIEAMSMGLPVIATNWSGNLEFMKSWNSYLINVENLITIETGPFKGHKWANPSLTHLKSLLRNVVQYPKRAKATGRVAARYIREKYSPAQVAALVHERILDIQHSLTIN